MIDPLLGICLRDNRLMAQFRKRGGETDNALEEITNRIEADVRSLADKLGKMLEEGSQ